VPLCPPQIPYAPAQDPLTQIKDAGMI